MEQTKWYDKWWGMVLVIMLCMVPAILFVRDIKTFMFVFAMFFFLGIVPVFVLIFPIAKLIEKLVFADRRRFRNRNLLAISFLVIGIFSAFIGIHTLIYPIPGSDIGGVVIPIILVIAGISSVLTFLMLLIIPLVWNIILKIGQRK